MTEFKRNKEKIDKWINHYTKKYKINRCEI